MDGFLALVESFSDFQLGQADLDTECGFDVAIYLRQCGILVHNGRHVQHLPCGIYKTSQVCCRWVKRFKGELFAVCESRASSCSQDIEPEYRDLKAWELDQEVFAAHIKQLLNLRGILDCKDWLQQPLWYLGNRTQGASVEEFYLLLHPGHIGFSMLLAQLSNTQTDCWVLVPTWSHVEQSIRLCYSVHTSITVCALSDLLCFDGRSLFLDCVLRKAQHRLFAKPASTPAPFCVLYRDQADVRMMNESDYNQFQHQLNDFSFLLDLQKPKQDGAHVARIVHDGKVLDVSLSVSEAHSLAYLMRHRCPLSARQIKPLQALSSPIQLIERARRKVEIGGRQGHWKYFQTVSAHAYNERRYHFAPISGMRWALVMPYQMVVDELSTNPSDALKHPLLQL